MAVEIERKFLVVGTAWRQGPGTAYSQGYLNRDKARTVRVRIADEQAWLTVKGANRGATRAEFEYEIPLADAEQLLALCDGPVVRKRRRVLVHAGATWEVDEFEGPNAGLVVAEIELRAEDQPFERPAWLGREVTTTPAISIPVWPPCRSAPGRAKLCHGRGPGHEGQKDKGHAEVSSRSAGGR